MGVFTSYEMRKGVKETSSEADSFPHASLILPLKGNQGFPQTPFLYNDYLHESYRINTMGLFA
jgi:hypothetical protein